jgi:uncharacterized DUF497 family protein
VIALQVRVGSCERKGEYSQAQSIFSQSATVFRDPNQLSIYDEEHSEQEDRWVTMGIDSGGVLRVVVHTFERVDEGLCEIRIVSARKATRRESHQYEEGIA